MTARISFQDAQQGLDQAVWKIFESFGGGRLLLKASGNVFLKVNGIDARPHVFTSPEVISAVIRYFKGQGAKRVYVMENSTQGIFTRLVFHATGIEKVCRDTGAVPVYLDEEKEMPLFLPELRQFVRIPTFVHEHLVTRRSENLYVSLPKLKSHSMTTVTLGIKNQFGLLHQKSRIADHNFNLHQKIADIFATIRPDFTLIDGLEATNHGHYPATSLADRTVVRLDLLCGGDDPLAVDVAGARLLGFDPEVVEHLALAAKYPPGEWNFDKMEIENRHLFEARRQNFSWDLLGLFPPDVRILRGRTRCCREGCRLNTEAVLELLAQDYHGKGGFAILMGKDIDPVEVESLPGPVHIAGDCAIGDWHSRLRSRIGDRGITCSPGCNNLAATVHGLTKWMQVSPLKISPVSPLKSLGLLIMAQLHGTRASIPPLISLPGR